MRTAKKFARIVIMSGGPKNSTKYVSMEALASLRNEFKDDIKKLRTELNTLKFDLGYRQGLHGQGRAHRIGELVGETDGQEAQD